MRIVKIKQIEPKEVFAIETSTGTFIADGLFHHNCQECNRVLNGNYKVYYPKLEKELGQEKYQKMWQKARSGDKISTPELEILLEKYNNLLKTLKK